MAETTATPEPTPDEPIGVGEVRDILWERLAANRPSLYCVTVSADGPAALAVEIRRFWQEEARAFRVTVEPAAHCPPTELREDTPVNPKGLEADR